MITMLREIFGGAGAGMVLAALVVCANVMVCMMAPIVNLFVTAAFLAGGLLLIHLEVAGKGMLQPEVEQLLETLILILLALTLVVMLLRLICGCDRRAKKGGRDDVPPEVRGMGEGKPPGVAAEGTPKAE